VAGLREIELQNDALRIGASVSLSDAYEALEALYPQVREMWERFASPPIRNAGTLGGNVANGSPIGDSMPWLIAVGTRVVLRNAERARTLALEDLYVDYMEKSMLPDEIVEAVEVPFPGGNQQFRTYKLSKRFDSDISAVCAAFAIELTADRVVGARIAFGGMAATPKRATHCEMALSGRPWSEPTVRDAMAALARDYTPLTDMRASSDYRTRTAANLLYRFYLETRPENPLPAEAVSVFAAA
jgi:xanthine dehydrogenase small subunit